MPCMRWIRKNCLFLCPWSYCCITISGCALYGKLFYNWIMVYDLSVIWSVLVGFWAIIEQVTKIPNGIFLKKSKIEKNRENWENRENHKNRNSGVERGADNQRQLENSVVPTIDEVRDEKCRVEIRVAQGGRWNSEVAQRRQVGHGRQMFGRRMWRFGPGRRFSGCSVFRCPVRWFFEQFRVRWLFVTFLMSFL